MLQIKDLEEILKLHKIPPSQYLLDGEFPKVECALCIHKKKTGVEVFWVERNEKSDIHTFDSEDQACKHFLKEFKIAV
jgi:hypothetical protein